MLKKLIKYDFIYIVNKVLAVFYIMSIFFAIMTRIFLSFENSVILNIIGKVCSGVTISMIFNILINCMMRSWHRFKTNFYGDESYLTHTLPIKKSTLILSKILTTFIILILSVFVIIVSLFIAYYSKENLQLVKNLLLPLATIYESTVISIILQFIFVCFLEIMNMILSGYFGIVIGHMKNNAKVAFSVLFGFVTYICTQLFTIFCVFIVALFNDNLMNLFYTKEALNIDTLKLCIILAVIVYSANIFILYILNTKMFSKGVNVD